LPHPFAPSFALWLKERFKVRVSDSVKNRDKLHLLLWCTLAMVALVYGGYGNGRPESDQIRASVYSD